MPPNNIKTVIDTIKALDPESLSREDIDSLAKGISGLRMSLIASKIQYTRNELKHLDPKSLSEQDRDFILDDIRQFVQELQKFLLENE